MSSKVLINFQNIFTLYQTFFYFWLGARFRQSLHWLHSWVCLLEIDHQKYFDQQKIFCFTTVRKYLITWPVHSSRQAATVHSRIARRKAVRVPERTGMKMRAGKGLTHSALCTNCRYWGSGHWHMVQPDIWEVWRGWWVFHETIFFFINAGGTFENSPLCH